MFDWLKAIFAGKSSISVSIPVADTFPNEAELGARNDVTDALDAKGIGEFVGAGGGFGQMDFQYNVSNPERAKALIAEVMNDRMPGQEYTVSDG